MAWVRRNCRQLVSVCRTGAGGMRWRFRIRRIVEAPTRWPSLSSSPWIAVSPARVLPRHPHHQGGQDVVDRWPSGPVRVGPSSADEAAMPAQDRVRGDQAMADAVRGAAAGRGRRTRPGLPSPGAVVGWCGAGRRLRGAARGARRPWWRTCGPAVGPIRAPAERSVSVVAVLRDGEPPGSVPVTRRDSRKIWPLRCALYLTCPPWLPAPAWPTSWLDQKSVRLWA